MDAAVRGYAAAIFEVAKAEGALETIEDELFRFARTVEAEPKLREALRDINLPPERRAEVVRELLGKKASQHTVNLVQFIVQSGRVRDLTAIADALVEKAAAERKKSVAEVRSAVQLDDEQRAKLKDAIASATGLDVEVKVIVDPGVVGGLLVRVGDQIFDGTIRRRLQTARENLKS